MTNSEVNISMAMGVIKIFGTNVLYLTVLYKLTTMNVFFHLSVGVADILSIGLSDQYNSLLLTDFSYL